MELTSLTAIELARTIRSRRASAREVTQAFLARIDRLAHLKAVVTLDAERALTRARAADSAQDRGESWGELHGVPFTLKDMHATAGVRTTSGLKALAHHVPAADGPVAERLRAAGAILLGKTNMAMNVESESDLFGRPLNPYDPARTAGGSSGGAAAALAARLAPLDVGTDLSGSIPRAELAGLRIGLATAIPGVPVSTDVRRSLQRLGEDLAAAGARVEEAPLPFAFEELLAAFRRLIRIPLAVLAAHGHAPPGAAALLESPPSPADMVAALAERDQLIQKVDALVAGHDAWICPAAPSAAFPHSPLGEPIQVDGETVSSQVIDHFSVLATYTGNPALVVPISPDPGGLPIGAQLIGRRWCDETLLAVGQVVADVVGPLPPPRL